MRINVTPKRANRSEWYIHIWLKLFYEYCPSDFMILLYYICRWPARWLQLWQPAVAADMWLEPEAGWQRWLAVDQHPGGPLHRPHHRPPGQPERYVTRLLIFSLAISSNSLHNFSRLLPFLYFLTQHFIPRATRMVCYTSLRSSNGVKSTAPQLLQTLPLLTNRTECYTLYIFIYFDVSNSYILCVCHKRSLLITWATRLVHCISDFLYFMSWYQKCLCFFRSEWYVKHSSTTCTFLRATPMVCSIIFLLLMWDIMCFFYVNCCSVYQATTCWWWVRPCDQETSSVSSPQPSPPVKVSAMYASTTTCMGRRTLDHSG